jgi:hypothetical protein
VNGYENQVLILIDRRGDLRHETTGHGWLTGLLGHHAAAAETDTMKPAG